jgi:hypothetical protein
VRKNGVRYHVVRVDYIVEWADQNRIADPDALRAKIALGEEPSVDPSKPVLTVVPAAPPAEKPTAAKEIA